MIFSIVMTEAYSPLLTLLRNYGKVENGVITEPGAQVPFNFEMVVESDMSTDTYGFVKTIKDWMNMPKGEKILANWVVSTINCVFFIYKII